LTFQTFQSKFQTFISKEEPCS